MENQIIKQYQGQPISFVKDKDVMVNATEMAKPFNKLAKDWLKTSSAQEFLHSLSAVRKILLTDLVQVRQGGDPKLQGTWMHQDVALEFARWLSPMFAIWCNDQIKELLTTGSVSFSIPRTYAEALRLAADQAEQIEAQSRLIAEQKPKADYFDNLVDRNLLTNFTTFAKQIGIPRKDLIHYLISNHYLFRDRKGRLMPYKEFTNLFQVKDWCSPSASGSQTLLTPRGKETFRLLLQSPAGATYYALA